MVCSVSEAIEMPIHVVCCTIEHVEWIVYKQNKQNNYVNSGEWFERGHNGTACMRMSDL